MCGCFEDTIMTLKIYDADRNEWESFMGVECVFSICRITSLRIPRKILDACKCICLS